MNFLQKYEALRKSIPVWPLATNENTINCELVDYVYQSKNCYFCFDSFLLEESMYCFDCWGKYLMDCTYTTESELCYQCIDTNKSYNCTYLKDCSNCTDTHFSALCVSCNDIFGCVGLSKKQYCIYNKQYSKEDYFKELKKLQRKDPQEILEKVSKIKENIPHPATQQDNNINSLYGDYIYNCKNAFWSFNAYYLEDCGYIFTGGVKATQCWDVNFTGNNSELCYEMIDCGRSYHSAFLLGCSRAVNCYYSTDLINCTDCIGCVGLTNKKYCILNNQLTKTEYEKAVKQLKKELGWR